MDDAVGDARWIDAIARTMRESGSGRG